MKYVMTTPQYIDTSMEHFLNVKWSVVHCLHYFIYRYVYGTFPLYTEVYLKFFKSFVVAYGNKDLVQKITELGYETNISLLN